MRDLIELIQMALILAGGLTAGVILILPLKFLLGDGPQGEIVALAVTAYAILAVIASCAASVGVARLLRVDR